MEVGGTWAQAGLRREFMVLVYQGGDKLKVPVESFDRVQKYASAEGTRPLVDKLGSGSWEKIKRRVKKAMRDMAAELLKLYAERKVAPGPRLHRREPLAAGVRGDLRVRRDAGPGHRHRRRHGATCRRSRPWTGSICGDVGYGKTEVAMRGGHARRARREAGGGAGPHHHPRLPALEDVPQALRALPGARGDGLALPHAEGDQGRPRGTPPTARSTSSSAPTACSARTSASATSASWSSTRSSASGWRPRRSSSSMRTTVDA